MTSPAQASHHEAIWTTTLTVGDTGGGDRGCIETSRTQSVKCSRALSSNTFTYNGVTYKVLQIDAYAALNTLNLWIEAKEIPDGLRGGALRVNNQKYPLSSARLSSTAESPVGAENYATWTGNRPIWTLGQTVTITLTIPAAQTLPTQNRLPFDDSIEHIPASQRTPTDSGTYCYLGEGNSRTEYIRYSNGRIREVPRQSAEIRSMFGC